MAKLTKEQERLRRLRRIARDPDFDKKKYERQLGRNPNLNTRRHEMRVWGEGTYDALVAHQGEKCAICAKTPADGHSTRLVIDHCHETGVVRGLLCSNHNSVIGFAGDDEVVLMAAIDYVLNPPCIELGLVQRGKDSASRNLRH